MSPNNTNGINTNGRTTPIAKVTSVEVEKLTLQLAEQQKQFEAERQQWLKEKALLEDKNKIFESIFEETLEGWWDWSIQDGTEYLSPKFKRNFGYKVHEMQNTPEAWQNIIHADDLPSVFEKYDAHIRSKGRRPYDNEVRFYHKDGSIQWVLCRGKVIEYDSDNKPKRMIGCHIDITKQKAIQEGLEESEERFRKIFENVGVGVALVDISGIPLLTNDALQDFLEYDNEELCAMSFAEFTHEDDVDSDLRLYNQLVEGKIPYYAIEKRYITKTGKTVWAKLGVSLLRNKKTGKPKYAIGIVQDITEGKIAALELEHANNELEQFVYLASHDLQEPLRTIISFVDILKEDYVSSLDQEAKEFIKYIKSSTVRMSALIDNLLDYSRIGVKKESESVDMNQVIREILDDLSFKIKQSNTSIAFDSLPSFFGFKTDIRVLLQNIISNAIKFADPKKKSISIELKCEKIPGKWMFSISDNGIGIEQKHFGRIFKIFQRLHNRADFEGTGIGLAHCKKIVELHGGEIWVESKVGIGSTFHFTVLDNL